MIILRREEAVLRARTVGTSTLRSGCRCFLSNDGSIDPRLPHEVGYVTIILGTTCLRGQES